MKTWALMLAAKMKLRRPPLFGLLASRNLTFSDSTKYNRMFEGFLFYRIAYISALVPVHSSNRASRWVSSAALLSALWSGSNEAS